MFTAPHYMYLHTYSHRESILNYTGSQGSRHIHIPIQCPSLLCQCGSVSVATLHCDWDQSCRGRNEEKASWLLSELWKDCTWMELNSEGKFMIMGVAYVHLIESGEG